MAIKHSDRSKRGERIPERVPEVPIPSSSSAPDGMERGRARARQFLPDAVDFLAAIGFSPDSEAPLHTRVMAVKEIVSIAGAIPQATPSPLGLVTDARVGNGREDA
jgi:hypothetical protein